MVCQRRIRRGPGGEGSLRIPRWAARGEYAERELSLDQLPANDAKPLAAEPGALVGDCERQAVERRQEAVEW
jgi:hypothetical protein